MVDTYKKIFALLSPVERRRGGLLVILFLFEGLAQAIGVASIMPLMAVIGDPSVVEGSAYLSFVYEALGFEEHQSFLVFLAFSVFVAVVGSQLFTAFTHWFMFRFTQSCNYRLSTRLMAIYFARSYVWYLTQHSANLGRTVLSEVETFVRRVLLPSLKIVSRAVVAAFLLALIVIADPIVAIFAAVVLGGMYVVTYLVVRGYLGRISGATWHANEQRFRLSQEGLNAIKDVKVSGLEQTYLSRFMGPARQYARYQANHQVIGELPKYILEAVAFGGMLLIVIFLLVSREQGLGQALPLLAVYAFAGYRLMPALQGIYHELTKLRYGNRVLERLHQEFTEQSQGTAGLRDGLRPSAAISRAQIDDRIELENVCFTYPGAGRSALDSVSIRIDAHTSVGFVGATGAGKTTIIDVILGLLQPDSGRFMVDGRVISAENVREWQAAVGYVPQHIFLADDSIAANIAFGVPPAEVSPDAVERAARIADLHRFVCDELQEGYDTVVGERGVRLSGGQRQRIGIARALYHDPDVLVLDEATSALDNLTEQAVMSAVRNIGRSKTILIIAHRLSTVRDCDVIFMMDQGRIVASGSFDELRRTSSQFRVLSANEA